MKRRFVLLVVGPLLILALLASKLLVQVQTHVQIFRMKDLLFPTFCMCCGEYKNEHGMSPITITDITNMSMWQRYFVPFDKRGISRNEALDDIYYIRNSNNYECGYIHKELTNGVEIDVMYGRCNRASTAYGTNVFLPLRCLSANELARKGFTGITTSGTLQMFVDDTSGTRQ